MGDKLDVATKKEIISANPKRELYAHGIATYDDIFGAPRRTEFCFFLNPSSFERDAEGNIASPGEIGQQVLNGATARGAHSLERVGQQAGTLMRPRQAAAAPGSRCGGGFQVSYGRPAHAQAADFHPPPIDNMTRASGASW